LGNERIGVSTERSCLTVRPLGGGTTASDELEAFRTACLRGSGLWLLVAFSTGSSQVKTRTLSASPSCPRGSAAGPITALSGDEKVSPRATHPSPGWRSSAWPELGHDGAPSVAMLLNDGVRPSSLSGAGGAAGAFTDGRWPESSDCEGCVEGGRANSGRHGGTSSGSGRIMFVDFKSDCDGGLQAAAAFSRVAVVQSVASGNRITGHGLLARLAQLNVGVGDGVNCGVPGASLHAVYTAGADETT